MSLVASHCVAFVCLAFNYYYIFSIFKFAVIMIRVVKKLEYYEIMPPGLNAHIDNHASQMLAKVLKEI